MSGNPEHHEQLVIFTRYPRPGAVKTRLAPMLGNEGAARLHKNLTEHVIRRVRPITRSRDLRLALYYTGGTREQMRLWLGRDIILVEQQGQDLGERMLTAVITARQQGAGRVVLIGSDCPALDESLIATALEKLRTRDLVLGPAADGGYYLIGLSDRLPHDCLARLFREIAWGTSSVYQQTINRARELGLSPAVLKPLHDIDLPDDLEHFNHHSNA